MAHTALIVIDPQKSFCDPDGSMARQGRPIETMAQAARDCDALADFARRTGVLVIWTRMVFAADYSDGGELIRTIRPGLAKVGALRRGSGDEELSALVSPRAEDIVIDKPRYSAVLNTDLLDVLERNGVERIFVTGMTTSMCVDTTTRDLSQRDYRIYVVGDCCADFDPDRHKAALDAMAFGFAKIVTTAEARSLMNGPLE